MTAEPKLVSNEFWIHKTKQKRREEKRREKMGQMLSTTTNVTNVIERVVKNHKINGIVALSMSMHPRLGESSPAHGRLSSVVLQQINSYLHMPAERVAIEIDSTSSASDEVVYSVGGGCDDGGGDGDGDDGRWLFTFKDSERFIVWRPKPPLFATLFSSQSNGWWDVLNGSAQETTVWSRTNQTDMNKITPCDELPPLCITRTNHAKIMKGDDGGGDGDGMKSIVEVGVGTQWKHGWLSLKVTENEELDVWFEGEEVDDEHITFHSQKEGVSVKDDPLIVTFIGNRTYDGDNDENQSSRRAPLTITFGKGMFK